MRMISASSLRNETKALFTCSILSFLEFITASLVTLSITHESKNAVLFGLSILRLSLLLFMLGVAVLTLGTGLFIRKRNISFETFLRYKDKNLVGFHFILLASCLFMIWAWLSLFSSPYLYGRWVFIFERLRPLATALGLSVLQIFAAGFFFRGRFNGLRERSKEQKAVLLSTGVFLIGVFGLTLFIAATKIGLSRDNTFWNMPGMPLSGPQYFGLLLLLVAGIYWFPAHQNFLSILRGKKVDGLIFAAMFLGAAVIWGATPIQKHANSLQANEPAYQPYPAIDARLHDAGGIAIVKGYGILFKQYTDKPLYMVFLAFLHLIGSYDYKLITLLQVCFLALIPALLYLLGVFFHSRTLGIFVSLAIILRQKNAIELAHFFDSANPKLFLTELPTMLGIILFSLCVFLWLRNPKPRLWMALLSGGVLGATSLVRANPMLLFPAVGLLSLLVLWKSFGRWLAHASFYSIGFLILVLPWAITGVSPEGQPWMILKFYDVINVRYNKQSDINLFPVSMIGAGGIKTSASGSSIHPNPLSSQAEILPKIPEFILMHSLHNVVGAVIALPDSLLYEDLTHLSQRDYWNYVNEWQGKLTGTQLFFVSLNLILLAIGLGYSWVSHKWSGLLPLLVFFVYAFALGFARNSGSRYLVPMDWVVYFYFGIGLAVALSMLRNWIGGAAVNFKSANQFNQAASTPAWKGLAISTVVLAAFASLIPIANILMVNDRTEQQNQVWAQQAIKAVPPDLLANSTVVFGEIFYPYDNEDGNFSFGLINKTGLKNFALKETRLAEDLVSNQRVLLGYQETDGQPAITFIFAGESGIEQVIWKSTP